MGTAKITCFDDFYDGTEVGEFSLREVITCASGSVAAHLIVLSIGVIAR